MAEQAPAEGEEKKSKSPLILIIAGVLVGCVVGGGGGFFAAKALSGPAAEEEPEGEAAEGEGHAAPEGEGAPEGEHGGGGGEEAAASGEHAAPAPSGGGHGGSGGAAGPANATVAANGNTVVALDSFVVNLRDSAGSKHLKLDVSIEVKSAASSRLEAQKAQVRDAIVLLASDYSYLELDGADGKMRLKDEIQRRVDAVLTPEKVERVYFTGFVVQ